MSYLDESDGLDRTHSASSNGESAVEAIEDDVFLNCSMEQLPCFHESTTRNVAEVLLLSADEGAFLIRPSRVSGNYSVSVRSVNSVKHFQIQHNGHGYDFGHAQFLNPSEIWTHLNNHPVLECDEGVKVHLLYPYNNEKNLHSTIPDPGYTTIRRHYLPEMPQTPQKTTTPASTSTRRRSSNIVTSMEGQLYKRKKGKTWKRRWCVLNKNFFSYKRAEKTKKELKRLDLSEAVAVVDDCNEPNMKYCFRIIFPKVYYVFASDCKEDKDTWFKSIKWQVDACSSLDEEE